MMVSMMAPAAMGAAGPAGSPPASSCSTGALARACSGGPGPGGACLLPPAQHRPAAPHGLGAAAAAAATPREWLYRLVTFPSYFTPCTSCCGGSRTPKREQLMTLFDTEAPFTVYCTHCPEVKLRTGGTLMQVRRSAFKDVVKATDLARFGVDSAGVQQYTLNGSKVIYLNREQAPEKKGSGSTTAPAQCAVDGRAMMDKSSQYCSLKCKMHAEDPGFNSWLDLQDPSVRILAEAAANAPPRPTVACKRASQPTSSGASSGGSATDGRPKKAARTSSSGGTVGAAAGAPAGQGTGDESAAPPRAAPLPGVSVGGSGPATACGLRSAAAAAAAALPLRFAAAPASLALDAAFSGGRQHSAPSAFLEQAMAEPQLPPARGRASASVWLPVPAELDCASGWCSWDESNLSSPSLAELDDGHWADGAMSPARAADACSPGSAQSGCDWLLGGDCSPPAGPFAAAGQGQGLAHELLAEQDAGLLVPSVGAALDALDLALPGMECLSGAALMAHSLPLAHSAPAMFLDHALPAAALA